MIKNVTNLGFLEISKNKPIKVTIANNFPKSL